MEYTLAVSEIDAGVNGELDLFVDGVLLQIADRFPDAGRAPEGHRS